MNVFLFPKKIWKKSKSYSKRYNNFSKKVVSAKFRAFFGGFLVVILLSLFVADSRVREMNSMIHVLPPTKASEAAVFPKLTSVLGSSTVDFSYLDNSITAQAAIVMDASTQTVLYSKNADLRFSMASTTKIMTALTALSYYKMSDILTVLSPTEGSMVGFTIGEQVTFENMLYGLLLPSGNDAALAIAQNYPGGEDAFIAAMNENAQKFNLPNTHFSDPAGLNDTGDYTTAVDLARLAAFAMKNDEFAKIVGTKERIISDVTGRSVYDLHNLNELLGYDGINGVKTGTTDEAGQVLVTSKNEKGHTLIIIVMKSQDRFADTERLLSLVSGNVDYINISKLEGRH